MLSKYTQSYDNVFTPEECNQMIEEYSSLTKFDDNTNYNYYNIDNFDKNIHKLMSVVGEYIKEYPETNLVASKFGVQNFRFKHFKPGYSFDMWHSENCITHPYRMLGIQIYLSKHDCGTEFYNGDYIKSEVGRVAIFPAYFTHTHRGQTCPDNKDRYIITSYVSFYEKGDKELNNA
jgi:hypothetical protein